MIKARKSMRFLPTLRDIISRRISVEIFLKVRILDRCTIRNGNIWLKVYFRGDPHFFRVLCLATYPFLLHFLGRTLGILFGNLEFYVQHFCSKNCPKFPKVS